MPPRQTPESLPQTPEATPAKDFSRYSSELQNALGLQEIQEGEWKNFLSLVNQELAQPQGSPLAERMRDELDKRYLRLGHNRFEAAKYLTVAIHAIETNQKIPQPLIDEILQNVAIYIDELDLYNHYWKGTVPSGTALPEYLARYVTLRPEEEFAVRMSKFMLPMQYDVAENAGIEESPRALAPGKREIFLSAVRWKLKMDYVLNGLNPDGTVKEGTSEPFEAFLKASGYETWREEDVQYVKLLIGYLGKHQEAIQRFADIASEGDISKLTIADAMKSTINSTIVGELAAKIESQFDDLTSNRIPDIRESLSEMFGNEDLYPDQMLQVALYPLAKLSANSSVQNKEQFQRDATAVGKFFMKEKDVRVVSLENHIQHLDNESQKTMVRELCKTVQEPAFVDKILDATLLSKENRTEASEELRRLIAEGEITLREAFELYYFSSLEGANPIPLGYKAVSILDDHGKSDLAKDLQHQMFRKVYDLALSDSDEVEEMIEDLGFTSEQKVEIENLQKYLKESALGYFRRVYEHIKAFTMNFPEIAIPMGIVTTGATLGPIGYAGYVKFNMAKLHKFAYAPPEELAKYGKNIPKLLEGQREAIKIITQYNAAHNRWRPFIKGGIRKEGVLVMNAARSDELADMANVLKSRSLGLDDLTQKLLPMAENEKELAKALEAAGYIPKDIQESIAKVTKQLGLPEQLTEMIESRAREFIRTAEDFEEELKRIGKMENVEEARSAKAVLRKKVTRHMQDVTEFEKANPSLNIRNRLAETVLGDLIEGKKLPASFFDAVTEAHKIPLNAPDALGKKFDVLMKSLEKVEGLDDTQRVAIAKRLLRTGITGELPTAQLDIIGAQTADEFTSAIDDIVRNVDSLDEVTDLRNTLESSAVRSTADSLDLTDDLRRTTKAVDYASDAADSAKLFRGGAKLLGKGIAGFAVLVDAYTMYDAYQNLKAAEAAGKEQLAQVLRSKFRDKGIEVGAGAIGLPAAFAVSGPVGWIALAGLGIKGVTSDVLYDYAEQLADESFQEMMKMPPAELALIMEGGRDWWLEGDATRQGRRLTALDAYARIHNVTSYNALDELYLRETSDEVSPENRSQYLKDKQGKTAVRMASFLTRFDKEIVDMVRPQQLEYAEVFAELSDLREKSVQMNTPELLGEYLEKLQVLNGNIPSTLALEDFKSADLFKVLDAMNERRKVDFFFSRYLILSNLLKQGEKKESEVEYELTIEVLQMLFKHDQAFYLSDFVDTDDAGGVAMGEYTVVTIVHDEIHDMLRQPLTADQFLERMNVLQRDLRKFLDEKKYIDESAQDIWGKKRVLWRERGKER